MNQLAAVGARLAIVNPIAESQVDLDPSLRHPPAPRSASAAVVPRTRATTLATIPVTRLAHSVPDWSPASTWPK